MLTSSRCLMSQSCISSFFWTTANWHITSSQTYYTLNLFPLLLPLSTNYNIFSFTWPPKLNHFIFISLLWVSFPNGWKFLSLLSSLLLAPKSSSLFHISSLDLNYFISDLFRYVLNDCFPCLQSLLFPNQFYTVAQLSFLAFCYNYINYLFKIKNKTSIVPYCS